MTKTQILSFLQSYKPDFITRFGVESIGIFGSVARDEATENSDVDIVVKMTPSFKAFIELQVELESKIGAKVDLVTMHNNMRPRFRDRIMKEAIFV